MPGSLDIEPNNNNTNSTRLPSGQSALVGQGIHIYNHLSPQRKNAKWAFTDRNDQSSYSSRLFGLHQGQRVDWPGAVKRVHHQEFRTVNIPAFRPRGHPSLLPPLATKPSDFKVRRHAFKSVHKDPTCASSTTRSAPAAAQTSKHV